MSRFDRYILSQSFVVFGFFTFVFVSIVWINRAVKLFDALITDGHSAGIFLEFSALALPSAMAEIVPLASFAATVYLTNRLSNESELVVMQATGYSPWRMARPFAIFGGIVGAFLCLLTLFLAPMAAEQQRLREAEISSDLSAKLLRDGVFQHPMDGITFYIRQITPAGELLDTYISDRRDPDRTVTYTAAKAYLINDGTDNLLVMTNGMAQTFNVTTQKLALTEFSDLTYSLGDILKPASARQIRVHHLTFDSLITDPHAVAEYTQQTFATVIEEIHNRLSLPLMAWATALVGFAAIYAAGFSRFGSGRFIMFAIFLLVLIKIIESAITGPTRTHANLWPLVYAPAAFGFLSAFMMLWLRQYPGLLRRHKHGDVI